MQLPGKSCASVCPPVDSDYAVPPQFGDLALGIAQLVQYLIGVFTEGGRGSPGGLRETGARKRIDQVRYPPLHGVLRVTDQTALGHVRERDRFVRRAHRADRDAR